MKVVQISQVPAQEFQSPLFTGGLVTRQALVTEDMGKSFNMSNISFGHGARNKLHSHSSDQVLIVTAGMGVVATETEERMVAPGDIIFIPAGEKHWHGATRDSAFSHISLTQASSKTEQWEE